MNGGVTSVPSGTNNGMKGGNVRSSTNDYFDGGEDGMENSPP
jgi:hypothetical protein